MIRTIQLLALALATALAAACGGNDENVPGSPDARVDASPGDPDATTPDADPDAPDAAPDDDAGVDAAPDDAGVDGAPGTPDAAAPDAPPAVTCGGAVCTDTQECCLGTNGMQSCVATGTCQGQTISCDGPEDCGEGEACCITFGETACAPAMSCQTQACHIDDDCPGTQRCCMITGNRVCSQVCPGPP